VDTTSADPIVPAAAASTAMLAAAVATPAASPAAPASAPRQKRASSQLDWPRWCHV
jgi:hypothetical protein